MVDNDDPRVVRTRRKLLDAYRELLEEHDLAPITVTSVVNRAEVTRSSFYAHFGGLGDLASVALTEFNEALIALARTAVREGGSKSDVNESVLRTLTRFLADHRDTYRSLLVSGGDFTKAITDALADQMLVTLRTRDRLHAVDSVVTARYMAGGLIAVLAWWLENSEDRTPEDLAKALISVAPRDFTD